MTPRRYALVGTGGRATMFVNPIVDHYRDSAQLVSLCDPNPVQRACFNDYIAKGGLPRTREYH